MPRPVIDIDRLNNLNAKMGKLTIPMKMVKKKVKTARKIARPIVKTAKKTKKKVKKMRR